MTRVEKIQYYISIVLKMILGVIIVVTAVRHQMFLSFASVFVLSLSFLPSLISRSFKINLPVEVDFVLVVALSLHYVLGEYENFYVKVSWWDLFLHAGNSVILGFVGFLFAYGLLLTSRIKAKPFFVAAFAFSFAVMIGALWEIFEFSVDQFFGFNMQKSGLVDTMTDIIMDVLGAFLVSALGFVYMKSGKQAWMQGVIERFAKK
ncbi:hypothetical protein EPO05_01960 [Patescibacteria group bacterium]|nr:MAG: hypothetical protein EPO05_01960 [Patescibacteria group bacterium]